VLFKAVQRVGKRRRKVGLRPKQGPEEVLAMSVTDREEAPFPFLRKGPPQAPLIGQWARAAFLPPETFQALLASLIGEWLEAGIDPTVAAAGEAAALAAYQGNSRDKDAAAWPGCWSAG
jgi:hypothetical protein